MDKFEEYRFFTERVQHRSDRRQQASQIYLTVNTAIFGLIILIMEDSGLVRWNLVAAILPLLSIGILICVIWLRIIFEFNRIIGWHYGQLREMEQQLQDSHKMLTKEWEEFYQPGKSKGGFSFSKLESRLPTIIICLYIMYAIGIAVTAILVVI